MARWIKADGTEVTVKPLHGKTFTLEELQKYVGGFIELVYTNDGKEMYLNEEGKLKCLPVNRTASLLYMGDDLIVGDVLVCGKGETS
jgi:hypothetical protein